MSILLVSVLTWAESRINPGLRWEINANTTPLRQFPGLTAMRRAGSTTETYGVLPRTWPPFGHVQRNAAFGIKFIVLVRRPT